MVGEERTLVGRSYLAAAVQLLHRVRVSHPTAGVWEAADLEWWWRKPRTTDRWNQPFWFVDDQPVAAAIATDWGGRLALDVITLPRAAADFVAEVFHRGLTTMSPAPVEHIEVMVDADDAVMAALLAGSGFALLPDLGTSAWMLTEDRPPISPLADGYRLMSRRELAHRPHHHASRNGPNVEQRLRETSLYRSDLDLVVIDQAGEVVAEGLFWYDPITRVGFVEPMGTDERHRRRGLARHVLTAGLGCLAEVGARRLKINYENNNFASSALYVEAGFSPEMTTLMFVRPQPTNPRRDTTPASQPGV